MARGRTESWGCRFRSRRPTPPCSPPTWSPSSALTKSAPSPPFVEAPEIWVGGPAGRGTGRSGTASTSPASPPSFPASGPPPPRLPLRQLAGPAGQLAEVAGPEAGARWGNYPQVQSTGGPEGGSARQLAPRAPRGEPGSPLIAHILSVGGAGTALSTLAPFV